ncbi:hypothetical protein [Leptospira bouyouniensis]|uniref:hypothetical protein n=1 Tax=Leptospira bouyouniensis TaxID=2484911 RepID=UPI0010913F17|nr:hypothetical protein [Leptospira bouyouniensis]TGM85079.1 hypothetical protein EHQ99_06400 [Leptospira bouyouniensis]
MKNITNFLLIFIFAIKCGSYQKYEEYKLEQKEINQNSKQLVLKFNNFDKFPLLLDVFLYKIVWKNAKEYECSDKIQEIHIKEPKEIIIPLMEFSPQCAKIFISYKTIRPFQKNENAFLNLDLTDNKDCLKLNYKSDFYPEYLNCKYLDFSKKTTQIVFDHIITQKTEIDKTVLTYGITFLTLVAQTPTSYLAPIPMSLAGYKTVKNFIVFEVTEI